jgi:predicted esterase
VSTQDESVRGKEQATQTRVFQTRVIRAKLWLLLLLEVLLPQWSAAMARAQKLSILYQGKSRTYFLYIPDNVSTPAPLLLLLHGSGRDGMSQIVPWEPMAKKGKIILLAPNSANSTQWTLEKDGPRFLHSLVEQVRSMCPIDEQRIYVFGHSAGAEMALYMAVLEPEYFAAAAIHAGVLREDAWRYMEPARRKIPIAIWVGTDDAYFPLSEVHRTRDALKSHGFPVQLVEMPHHDHDYYRVAEAVNRDAWEFLRKVRLEEQPKWSDAVVFSRSTRSDYGEPDLDVLEAVVRHLERSLRGEVNYTPFDERELQRKLASADPFVEDLWHRKKIRLVAA